MSLSNDKVTQVLTPSLLDNLDVPELYSLKERLWKISHLLLPIRNEFARQSWEIKSWQTRKGKYNEIEKCEVLLARVWQRLFYILLEYPY